MISERLLPDLDSPDFKANPYPHWARLRAESPVHPVPLQRGGSLWLVTRYHHAVDALQDDRLVKSPAGAMTPEQLAERPWSPGIFKPLDHSLLNLDPPDHTRLRALMSKGFVPSVIGRLRGRIEAICERLLDEIVASGPGPFDLVHAYAEALPSTITAELLGVSTEHLDRWSRIYLFKARGDVIRELLELWAFMGYLRGLFVERRAAPRDDLITALVQSQTAGAPLSDDELISMVILLFEAGHVTTVNLIGSGVLALLQHPDQLDLLRREPDLIVRAVEELLRFTNPLDLATPRFAREDLTIANASVRRGEEVLIALGSANRDERKFDDPERLDIRREPNEHLALGWGRHYCLGAGLARLEAQIAIGTLLARLPDLRLAQPPETLRWRGDTLLRGLVELPLAF